MPARGPRDIQVTATVGWDEHGVPVLYFHAHELGRANKAKLQKWLGEYEQHVRGQVLLNSVLAKRPA